MGEVVIEELLIKLVRDRPILWDRTQDCYKDRILTKSAWLEIFKELNDCFEELSPEEKNTYGRAVMKRWTNIRDSFQRSERKNRISLQTSGSGRQQPKTYIYSKQLQFLKRTSEGGATEDTSDDDRGTQSPSNCENDGDGSNLDEGLDTEEPEVMAFKKPRRMREKRKLDPVELELISTLNRKPDRHTSFFNGIIPSLETFDDDEIAEFQLKVLQAINEIKIRKKASANINQITHLGSSQQ
ncbi:uncharacterized protein [Halyomorpha halys]|uniref:uncharacterized protein n=1 Tax=Halyomorpha halys TaxID=286706 RepID=UPI0006D4EAE7|nr:uncharacterized protein LOC106682187 [Halyomorpha halys]